MMGEGDFPAARMLGEEIFEDPAYPMELKDLLFESLRLHRLIVGRDLPPRLRPQRLEGGSWLLPGMVVLPSGEEEVRPRELISAFMSTTQRFEIALHRELVFGRLRVRGRPIDRPGESVLVPREMWDVLTPTLAFMPVTRGNARDPGFQPRIDARGERSAFFHLKPVPLDWVATPGPGLARARQWMADNVKAPGALKRRDSISACCKATQCTTRDAETAWMELPHAVRRTRGRPKKNEAMK